MSIARPKYASPILIAMGLLALAFPIIAVCSALCPTDNSGGILFQHANCGITIHAFVFIGAGLSALFILPLIGIFFANKEISIPAGYLFPMFKPPRFFSESIFTY